MSGQTVTGLGLQFTDDNKKCYGYSGLINAAVAESTILNFDTTSSYIEAKVQPYYDDNSTNDLRFRLKINDVIVQSMIGTSANAYTPSDEMWVIIPPNVNFKITVENLSAGAINAGVSLVGDVGMAQRVGNLVE